MAFAWLAVIRGKFCLEVVKPSTGTKIKAGGRFKPFEQPQSESGSKYIGFTLFPSWDKAVF